MSALMRRGRGMTPDALQAFWRGIIDDEKAPPRVRRQALILLRATGESGAIAVEKPVPPRTLH